MGWHEIECVRCKCDREWQLDACFVTEASDDWDDGLLFTGDMLVCPCGCELIEWDVYIHSLDNEDWT